MHKRQLARLGVLAVGLCPNTLTDGQVEKIARSAKELAGGVASLMFDCDPEGEKGARQALWKLAQQCCVRLAWSSEMLSGQFRGQQPGY